jgi:hypothetical protein
MALTHLDRHQNDLADMGDIEQTLAQNTSHIHMADNREYLMLRTSHEDKLHIVLLSYRRCHKVQEHTLRIVLGRLLGHTDEMALAICFGQHLSGTRNSGICHRELSSCHHRCSPPASTSLDRVRHGVLLFSSPTMKH